MTRDTLAQLRNGAAGAAMCLVARFGTIWYRFGLSRLLKLHPGHRGAGWPWGWHTQARASYYPPAMALPLVCTVYGSLREYMGQKRHILRKKIGRTRASAARGCANTAPAAMPPPTEAREGCSGLVGEACARQLDGGVDGRRTPYRRR